MTPAITEAKKAHIQSELEGLEHSQGMRVLYAALVRLPRLGLSFTRQRLRRALHLPAPARLVLVG